MESHHQPENPNPFLESARREAVKTILSHQKGQRIDISTFHDIYGDEVNTDQDTVEKIKISFKNKDKFEDLPKEDVGKIQFAHQRAEALEIVVSDYGELCCWFGENCFLQRTSEYDDFVNNVDMVLEYDYYEDGKPERFALVLDTSMHTSEEVINKKISRNITKMKDGQMKLKYFESQVDGFKGELTEILPVVVGVDYKSADDLMTSVAQILKLEDGGINSSEHKQKLAQNPAQLLFLNEIRIQLEMYQRLGLLKDASLIKIINEVISSRGKIVDPFIYQKLSYKDEIFKLVSSIANSKK